MTSRTTRIAVDAMGGDDPPGFLVEGSIAALEQHTDIEVTLVGDRDIVQGAVDGVLKARQSRKQPAVDASVTVRLKVVHAAEVIGMDESPARAIRTKKDSSVVIANKLCRSGDVDAVISAGSTGAAMASSLLYMGRLQGVMRPAIMALFPSQKNIVAILDVGANPDCKPEHLYQFGVMASLYTSTVLGYENPRVGILSIGEERGKGNELTNAAYELFEDSELNFIGNIEGRDIFKGVADVVVCDGFVGNILLKFGESIFGFVTHMLRKKASVSLYRKLCGLAMKPMFREIKKDMSPEDYGGAPLIGVDGVSIICHGNSTPVAITNAIRVARQLVMEKVNDQIKTELARKNAVTE